MKMTELFAKGYATKAQADTLDRFTKRCRLFGDKMDTNSLKAKGVSGAEITAEQEAGLIKYEPNCGVTRRSSGYSLTAKGIRKVYRDIHANR